MPRRALRTPRSAAAHARTYNVEFRSPATATIATPTQGFVALGTMTAKELARAARQKAQAAQTAERKRLKAEAAKAKQESQRAARAERLAEATRRAEAEAAARRYLEAWIAALAWDFQVAFDLKPAEARRRAEELVARERANRESGQVPPMSETAAEMYG
jgi:hypothetical protein